MDVHADATRPDSGSEASRPGGALARRDFPWARVAGLLGMDPSGAEVAMRDAERARAKVRAAAQAFREADDDRRAGRTPGTALAAHPDFPTGLGMSLVGASVLWDTPDVTAELALRVAKDHHEGGEDELAASFIALIQEVAQPGRDDAAAWAAQSLLVSVMQRQGDAAGADALARDLAAHGIPIDLWRDAAPCLPEDSLAWHGGALVAGLGPRRDDRAISVEAAQEHLQELLEAMERDRDAEKDAGH